MYVRSSCMEDYRSVVAAGGEKEGLLLLLRSWIVRIVRESAVGGFFLTRFEAVVVHAARSPNPLEMCCGDAPFPGSLFKCALVRFS